MQVEIRVRGGKGTEKKTQRVRASRCGVDGKEEREKHVRQRSKEDTRETGGLKERRERRKTG